MLRNECLLWPNPYQHKNPNVGTRETAAGASHAVQAFLSPHNQYSQRECGEKGNSCTPHRQANGLRYDLQTCWAAVPTTTTHRLQAKTTTGAHDVCTFRLSTTTKQPTAVCQYGRRPVAPQSSSSSLQQM